MDRDVTQQMLVAIGANQPSRAGTPLETVLAALQALSETGPKIEAVSQMYATPCFPLGAGPDYVNAAVRLRGTDQPDAMLALLHKIEARFDRQRVARWASRSLDLDLIAVGNSVVPSDTVQDHWRNLIPEQQQTVAPDQLILPHPRLQDRAFVLVPLRDVAPDWVHPRIGKSVTEMLAALPAADRNGVRAMGPAKW